VIKQILRSRHLDEKMYSPGLMLNLISSAKNELMTPVQYRDIASGKMQEMAADIYPGYQNALKEAGAMDFDDMIMQLVRLLRENPEVLTKYQQQFRLHYGR
jgi:DNA helicase-2/ATP-dependent DNA helicase PcrA